MSHGHLAFNVKCKVCEFNCHHHMLNVYVLSCSVCNVFHCCFSYHALLELHYTDKWNKLAAAKKWTQAEGISVWEVEQCLDVDLFLNEYPQWKAGGPQCPVILQGMFAHPKMAGQKEFEWAICHGCQQSYPGVDAKAEVPTIQLVGLKTLEMISWNSIMMFTN